MSKSLTVLSLVLTALATVGGADAAPKRTAKKAKPKTSVAAKPAAATPPPVAAAPAAPSAGSVRVTLDCKKADASNKACSVSGDHVGAGPAFVNGSIGAEIGSGFVEGTTLYVMSTSATENQYDKCQEYCAISALYKVDLTTGNRTIVSGYYKDPRQGVTVTGSGPYWSRASSVVRGSDGSFFVYTNETNSAKPHVIYKVDAKGDRAEVWSSATRPCDAAGATFSSSPSIAAGPNNTIYMAGDIGQSRGAVAKLDVVSGKCSVFSASGTNLGSGATSSVLRGPAVVNGKLYALGYNEVVMQFNLATGARMLVSKGSGGGIVGTGPYPGTTEAFAGSSGNVWTTGGQARRPVSVDIESGNRAEAETTGPAESIQLHGYAELTGKVIVGGYLDGVYLLDTTTNRSVVVSR